jgi:hypothetical protein
VDFDAGDRATKKRMRRLLAGHAVTSKDITNACTKIEERRGGEPCAEAFEVERDPRLQYAGDKVNVKDTTAFERAWTQAVRGFDVVILDSLRKVAPSLDENDSRSGELMAALGRVSDTTGVTIIVIHHAGRRGSDKGPKKPLQETGRGTSAYDGHAGAQVIMTREDERRRCEIGREAQEADRPAPEPWYLELVRVTDDDGHPVGHRIEHRAVVKDAAATAGAARLAEVKGRVLDYLRQQTTLGHAVPGIAVLATAAKADKGIVGPVFRELIKEGLAEDVPEQRGRGGAKPAFWALRAEGFGPPARPSLQDNEPTAPV